jgi:hypothetical protein
MKIEILRSVMISGELAEAGSFPEVSVADANLLIGMGKARLVTETPAAPAPEPEAPKKSRKPAPAASEED